ncbi:MAG TPA: hypothetical protein IAC47_05725 [Candidatus Onthomorpha intestinigallinarum]|uniref:Uncharacterized protein n=1 Tax=Candidatus Onthomorpha intestinigallinarum TaxID=2840880 RepID=A0A9D1RJF9_9BACT|nr:hypothetical protein [Candidatus Onthomorpha intestinigallinarum]
MKKLFSFLAVSVLCSVAIFAQDVNGKYILDKENSNITKYISETADSNGTELATVLILDDKTRDDVSSFLYDKAVPTELVIKNDKMTFVFPDKTEVSSNIEINKESKNPSLTVLDEKGSDNMDIIIKSDKVQKLDWHGIVYVKK